MKKLLLISGFAVLALGAAILLYDAYFIHRYGVDATDAVAADGQWAIPWPTGERPAFAEYPAWKYGIAFVIIGSMFFLIRLFLFSRQKLPIAEKPV